jgi:glycosyltransferase involved in cell wall biosynthesis
LLFFAWRALYLDYFTDVMPMQQQSRPLLRKKALHAVCRNHYKKIVDTATDRGLSMGYSIIAREALRAGIIHGPGAWYGKNPKQQAACRRGSTSIRHVALKTMRIAQISPLYESVPPRYYGGTERIVSYLTEELHRQGHEVTLFASGDSVTSAELVAVCPRSLRLNENCVDQMAHHILMLEHVFQLADGFDVLHFHVDYLHFLLSRRQPLAQVTTLHGRLDIPDLAPLYQEFREMPLVSISNAQREPLPWANWQATVYHGLPECMYRFQPEQGTYFAFLGRISPEKRVDRAVEIAKRVGIPLKIAAKVDRADKDYFEATVKPLLDDSLIEYVGEIGDGEKDEFLGKAFAMLFPIDWPEPFGLVMIEAMACGTPVIAYRNGSVPEIMEQGRTGFIVTSLDDAVAAARMIPKFNRVRCREIFEQRFSARRMAADYVRVYERLICPQPDQPARRLTHGGRGSHSRQRTFLHPLDVTPHR